MLYFPGILAESSGDGFSPNDDINKEELFHLILTEKTDNHGSKGFDLKDIWENTHEVDCQWGHDIKDYKGVPLTCNRSLIHGKDGQHHESSVNFPLKQNVSVTESAYQNVIHDEPFIRNVLKLKNHASYSGKKYLKCFENRIGLSLQAQLAE